jgi:hypothetical protein
MRRALAAVPVVAIRVVLTLVPVRVLLVARDVRKHRRIGLRWHVGPRIGRLGHLSIVGGAWISGVAGPELRDRHIEEATP